jgi:TRAP-type C4-dicarboxylate transport system substrate-binding protein
MSKVRCTGLVIAVIFAVAFILPCFVSAQDKVIELKYGTTYGADHPFSMVDKKYIEKIEKDTKGRVKIKPYWGGTLFAGQGGGFDELTKGVVDIGMIQPSYSKSGFTLLKGMYLFTFGANQETGRRILKDLRAKFPEIDKEYEGVKVLAYTSGVDYDLITRKPVRKMEDLKGMRLKVTADFAPVFTAFGAEGVNSPMPEAYQMVQKGIMDGLMGSLEGLKSFRLAEVAKYYTYIGLYRTHNGSRAMDIEVWNKLPADIKKVFEDNIEWWGLENDKYFEGAHQAGLEFGKQQKVEFITLSKDELAKFYGPLKTMAEKEAKMIDGKGLPGTKVYQEAQALVKKYAK